MSVIYPKSLFHKSFKKINKASCFVLMPFSKSFDDVYEVIGSTLQSQELNLICRRADDFRSPNILETILINIAQSEYIVADLSSSNPNVFYELGIAHCIKDAENVIILSQHLDFVPFDLRQLRCIIYEQSHSGLEALRKELLNTFKDVSKDAFRFRIWEGKKFLFAKKLVGENNNLFELTFECAHIGHGAVKLLIHFSEHSITEETEPVKSQFLFLSEDKLSTCIANIPWSLHLVEFTNEETEALLVLEKWKAPIG